MKAPCLADTLVPMADLLSAEAIFLRTVQPRTNGVHCGFSKGSEGGKGGLTAALLQLGPRGAKPMLDLAVAPEAEGCSQWHTATYFKVVAEHHRYMNALQKHPPGHQFRLANLVTSCAYVSSSVPSDRLLDLRWTHSVHRQEQFTSSIIRLIHRICGRTWTGLPTLRPLVLPFHHTTQSQFKKYGVSMDNIAVVRSVCMPCHELLIIVTDADQLQQTLQQSCIQYGSRARSWAQGYHSCALGSSVCQRRVVPQCGLAMKIKGTP
jgi:hypothetical protein